MENREILTAFLMVWVPYVVGVHAYAQLMRLNHGAVLLSHLAPSLVAVSMAYVFVLNRGATVAQFAAGSDRAMELWSLWVDLWPVLLQATFVSAAIQALTAAILLSRKETQWAPILFAGAVMSAFALMTVAYNFPDA
jgi:hypothetical protein